MLKIAVQPVHENGKNYFGVKPFGFDPGFPGIMKTIPGAFWSPATKCWLISAQQESLAHLKARFGTENVEVMSETSPEAEISHKTVVETSHSAENNRMHIRQHPNETDRLLLFVPKVLTGEYLATVKNIHGRRWNPDELANNRSSTHSPQVVYPERERQKRPVFDIIG